MQKPIQQWWRNSYVTNWAINKRAYANSNTASEFPRKKSINQSTVQSIRTKWPTRETVQESALPRL